MSPGERLKEIRKKLNLSQRQMAVFLSMSQSGWSNCENGSRNLSITKCYKLIKLSKLKEIDLTIEYLRPSE